MKDKKIDQSVSKPQSSGNGGSIYQGVSPDTAFKSLKDDITMTRVDLKSDIEKVDSKMDARFDKMDARFDKMWDKMDSNFKWMIALLLTGFGIMAGLIKL